MRWKQALEAFRIAASFIITLSFSLFVFSIIAVTCFGKEPLTTDVFGRAFDLGIAVGAWIWLSALAITVLEMRRGLRRKRTE